jgi:hypothetical protein
MTPNSFLAAKGSNRSIAVAERKAWYDGALGAQVMASLESYGQGKPSDSIACVLSSIYHGGQIKMFPAILHNQAILGIANLAESTASI